MANLRQFRQHYTKTEPLAKGVSLVKTTRTQDYKDLALLAKGVREKRLLG